MRRWSIRRIRSDAVPQESWTPRNIGGRATDAVDTGRSKGACSDCQSKPNNSYLDQVLYHALPIHVADDIVNTTRRLHQQPQSSLSATHSDDATIDPSRCSEEAQTTTNFATSSSLGSSSGCCDWLSSLCPGYRVRNSHRQDTRRACDRHKYKTTADRMASHSISDITRTRTPTIAAARHIQ